MPTIETLSLFCTASILLSLSPGPDNLFVLTQSLAQGARAGLFIILGLCTGLLLHSMAAVLGVAVIFQTSEWAFTALKLIGAAYLLYLAWGAFQADTEQFSNQSSHLPLKTLYSRGILMSATNPKLSIFFLAFLPPFVDPQLGSVTLQLTVLSGLFIVMAFIVFNGIALLAGQLSHQVIQSKTALKKLHQISAIVFVALAIKLILD